MSLLNLKIEKWFTKLSAVLLGGILAFVFFSVPVEAWEVDLSRRAKTDENKAIDEMRWPASVKTTEELFSETSGEGVFSSIAPAQAMVILNTAEGFVPNTLRLRKDGNYKIYLANVNEKSKNASFILDSFGQSLGTFFGKPKNFDLKPKVTGIFTFLCPETGAQGKIIVFSEKEEPNGVSISQNLEAKK